MNIYRELADYALSNAVSNTIDDCAVGENCVAVKSGPGSGMSFIDRTPSPDMPLDSKGKAALEDEVRGMSLQSLIGMYFGPSPLYRALALAAINSVFGAPGHTSAEFPLSSLLGSHERLGMVGCFHPLMPHVRESGISLTLFELRPMPGAHNPDEAPALMPQCDMVIISGSTFVNRTFHFYLPHLAPVADVYIMGPSTPLCPALASNFNLGGSVVKPGRSGEAFSLVRHGKGYRQIQHLLHKVIKPAHRKAA